MKHPRALLVPLQQARIAEQLEMPAYAGLALVQDPGQFTHGQFALLEHGEDSETCGFAGGTQGVEKLVHEIYGDGPLVARVSDIRCPLYQVVPMQANRHARRGIPVRCHSGIRP